MKEANFQDQWDHSGFFVVRGLIPQGVVSGMTTELIERIRADPPAAHPGEGSYFSGSDHLIRLEAAPDFPAENAEDRVSRVFNCHVEGAARDVAASKPVADIVCAIMGPAVDCFQSQFLFKNPGAIGQPWHQDSYYFAFDRQPQMGVWVALSKATIENGCLWVLPGSHNEPVHPHIPDKRPDALSGYLEIVDHDFKGRIPVLMEPGDVLFFHSHLMHMSTDNVTDYRRCAMVYHYGVAGTGLMPGLPAEKVASLGLVNRWVPVRRGADAA